MGRRYHHGLVLFEVLVVIGILSVIMVSILLVVVQAGRVYGGSYGYLQVQEAQSLALKRLGQELREAMAINTTTSSATRLDVVMPAKDSSGANLVVQDASGNSWLQAGQTVTYFLGVRQSQTGMPGAWQAVPSDTGDTLFKVTDCTPELANNTNAHIVIEGLSTVGETPPTPLFVYGPTDQNGVLPSHPDLVTITLPIPVAAVTGDGRRSEAIHTLSTELHMRNVITPPSSQS